MSGDRYTKADVAYILANVNAAGERLGMRGAGHWVVETRGGNFLYLDDRSNIDPAHPTSPGERIIDLGRSWHAAGDALITFVQHLHTVEIMQERR